MALIDIRRRVGYLFLAVVVGHIILISAQVQSRSGAPVLQAVVFGAFAQIQQGTWTVVSAVRGVWQGYVDLRRVRSENLALKQRLSDAEILIQEQRALAERSRGLARMLELREGVQLKTVAAEIIAAAATPDFRTVTIDKGTFHGVRRDMAVIAPAGAVGRVVVPGTRAAKVQLLIDRNAAAGALIERSRAQGIVVGTGDGRLRMEYVSDASDVSVGDVVVTSGIDGIFPKGFAIGRIDTVDKLGVSYRQILVRPAVDFSSLEEVAVVLTPTPAHEASEERDR